MPQPTFESQIYDEPYSKTFSVRNVLLVTSLISGLTGWVLWKLGVEYGIIFAIIGFIGMVIYDRVDFGDRPVIGEPITSININESGIQIGPRLFTINQIENLSIKTGHWKDRRTKRGKNYFNGGTENALTFMSDSEIIRHHFMVINANHLTELNEVLETLAQEGLKIAR